MGIENGGENQEKNSLKMLIENAVSDIILGVPIPEGSQKDIEVYMNAHEINARIFVKAAIDSVEIQLKALIEVISSAKAANIEVYDEFIKHYSSLPDSIDIRDGLTNEKKGREIETNNHLAERLHSIRTRTEALLVDYGVSQSTAESIMSVLLRQNIKLV